MTRWLELEGTANTRDLGGLPIAGGRVRPGVALRSDNLTELTTADVALLVERIGVRTVLDLRTDGERRVEGPGPLQRAGVRHLSLSVVPEIAGDRVLPDRRREDPTEIYLDYLRDAPQSFATAFRVLADPAAGAVIFHCAAGKDRTGVLAALLLSCLGASRADILTDYLASNEVIDAVITRLAARPAYREDVARVPRTRHLVRAEVLGGVLDQLATRWGSACAWVAAGAMVSADTMSALRERLVVPAGQTGGAG